MAAWALAFGALVGLGLNVLLDQLPLGTGPRAWPRCPACRSPLTWSTYAAGLRPCPVCGRRRWRPWLLPLGLALASAALALTPHRMGFWPLWVFLVYTAFDVVLDLEHRVVFPDVELVAAVVALALGWWRRGWALTLWGGAAGLAWMGLMYLLGRWLSRRWEARGITAPGEPALGSGDVLVAVVLGLFVGWPAVLAALFAAVLLAGFFAIGVVAFHLVRGRGWPRQVYFPYVPFLFAGTWWVLFL